MAFVTAVAAFGQRLRGDKYLNGYGYRDIVALAGSGGGYWREEFGRLVRPRGCTIARPSLDRLAGRRPKSDAMQSKGDSLHSVGRAQ
ncbi:MAG: hypothetical protein WDN24_05695 [Sphingomonas sp.]